MSNISDNDKPMEIITSHKPEATKTDFIDASTPFEVIHEDLEMYRAIVDAFKLLSNKYEGIKKDPVSLYTYALYHIYIVILYKINNVYLGC